MAAVKRDARQAQDANPHLVDTTEIPVTPVMEGINELAKLAYDLDAIKEVIGDLLIDASVIGLAQGHNQRSVMLAQGRDFSWRAQLKKLILRERGIDITAQGHYRERAKSALNTQRIPGYLDIQHVEPLIEQILAIKTRTDEIAELRKSQAPAALREAKAAIEGSRTAKAS